jgi:hypothetical protein
VAVARQTLGCDGRDSQERRKEERRGGEERRGEERRGEERRRFVWVQRKNLLLSL